MNVKTLPAADGLRLVLNPKDILAHFKNWDAEHGRRYRLSVLGTKMVVFGDPAAVHQILRDRPAQFKRMSAIESVFAEMGIGGLFSVEGAEWKRRRRLVTPAFNPGALRGFGGTLDLITERLRQRWQREPQDVHADLMRYTLDVMANIAFGYDLNTLEGGGDAIEQRLQQLFPALGRRVTAPIPYWRWVKLPADRRLDRALADLRREVGEVIEKARANQGAEPSNFIEAMLRAQDGDDPLTADELYAEALTVLVAGQDTTANSIAWLLYHLAQHPHVQQRLRAEVTDGTERTYLDAVIQESMRVQPVAAFLYLEALEDVVVDGIEIPAGTAVVTAQGRSAADAANFVDPEQFRPERWLPGHTGTHQAKASIPFGTGPRFCPGRNLALLEIEAVVRMVLRDFEVSIPDGAPAPKEVFTFAAAPEGLVLRLTPVR
ncbi:cytochrome P450 [Nocardia stercoris]|uniref:Cytochrome P450 n=1 Tax=Nocardia stercoris TaxID=2483361 RepID=A0A3M2LDL4_9NOCA|nr:cytochrome P450 [Nocardia stercoris]RMI35562.1 cytochrome P450 [Nocardia stercoris]